MRQKARETTIRSLAALGFTELEATVYSYLVENSPATGYRVASAAGKPVANTYKALESLEAKGAVIVDIGSENRMCRAVPPSELLQRLRKGFEQEFAVAETALSSLQPSEQRGGIFALTSVEQVYDRCRQMLESAEDIVLVDAFPGAVGRLAPLLEAAARRRVTVAAQVYEETTIRGVATVLTMDGARTLARWPGQWICVVVDGAEYLFAYLDRQGETVKQAVWSDSALVSWVQHSYLGSAMRDQVLERLVRQKASPKELQAALALGKKWSALNARGYAELNSHFR